jgi:hypothetical protein
MRNVWEIPPLMQKKTRPKNHGGRDFQEREYRPQATAVSTIFMLGRV